MRLAIHKDIGSATVTRVPRKNLQRLFAIVTEGEKLRSHPSMVNLVFTGDQRMRKLNREYRARDATTDVLSFNIDSVRDREGTFGEVYISVPVAHRQAGSLGHSVSREYLRLFCHGLLHLCGYDHEVAADENAMRTREDRYLLKALSG